MKTKVGILAVSLLALAGVFAAAPSSAQSVLYDNTGPTSLTTNAWSFSSGVSSVTDSFSLSQESVIDGVTFDAWINPGDSLASETWAITTTPFGTPIATGNVTGGPNTQVATADGYYPVLAESISLPPVSLGAGTYWLQLSNGLDSYDVGVWWDESSGLSTAYSSASGLVPSETFQILGVVPEGGSFLLYLLLAIASCGGAILVSARSGATPRASV
ncbi:MAG: hypothetical protein ACRD3N_15080 [Terracidiphilus sp.]